MGIYLYLIIITVDTNGSRMWVLISRWNEKIMTMVAITTADEKYVQLQLIQCKTFLDKYYNNNLQRLQLLRWTKYICNQN